MPPADPTDHQLQPALTPRATEESTELEVLLAIAPQRQGVTGWLLR